MHGDSFDHHSGAIYLTLLSEKDHSEAEISYRMIVANLPKTVEGTIKVTSSESGAFDVAWDPFEN